MGKACCAAKGQHTYEFNGKQQKIAVKDATTINRFAQGANARISLRTKKQELAKEIADLEKPTLFTAPKVKETLMSAKEWGDYNVNKKDLVWKNFWTKVDARREYKGEFKSDDKEQWEGLGYLKFADGSMYAGQVKAKNMNGKGRMVYANGDIYQGEWKDGKAHGQGVFVDMANQTIYEGQWADEKQHGQGTETWDNGLCVYKGAFQEGKKTGKARYEQDGSIYEGDLVEGKFHGKGKYTFAETGKVYEGDFKNNRMVGKGEITAPNALKFRV